MNDYTYTRKQDDMLTAFVTNTVFSKNMNNGILHALKHCVLGNDFDKVSDSQFRAHIRKDIATADVLEKMTFEFKFRKSRKNPADVIERFIANKNENEFRKCIHGVYHDFVNDALVGTNGKYIAWCRNPEYKDGLSEAEKKSRSYIEDIQTGGRIDDQYPLWKLLIPKKFDYETELNYPAVCYSWLQNYIDYSQSKELHLHVLIHGIPFDADNLQVIFKAFADCDDYDVKFKWNSDGFGMFIGKSGLKAILMQMRGVDDINKYPDIEKMLANRNNGANMPRPNKKRNFSAQEILMEFENPLCDYVVPDQSEDRKQTASFVKGLLTTCFAEFTFAIAENRNPDFKKFNRDLKLNEYYLDFGHTANDMLTVFIDTVKRMKTQQLCRSMYSAFIEQARKLENYISEDSSIEYKPMIDYLLKHAAKLFMEKQMQNDEIESLTGCNTQELLEHADRIQKMESDAAEIQKSVPFASGITVQVHSGKIVYVARDNTIFQSMKDAIEHTDREEKRKFADIETKKANAIEAAREQFEYDDLDGMDISGMTNLRISRMKTMLSKVYSWADLHYREMSMKERIRYEAENGNKEFKWNKTVMPYYEYMHSLTPEQIETCRLVREQKRLNPDYEISFEEGLEIRKSAVAENIYALIEFIVTLAFGVNPGMEKIIEFAESFMHGKFDFNIIARDGFARNVFKILNLEFPERDGNTARFEKVIVQKIQDIADGRTELPDCILSSGKLIVNYERGKMKDETECVHADRPEDTAECGHADRPEDTAECGHADLTNAQTECTVHETAEDCRSIESGKTEMTEHDKKLAIECMYLSDGTMAGLTGIDSGIAIEKIQTEFVLFVQSGNAADAECWQDAWELFRKSEKFKSFETELDGKDIPEPFIAQQERECTRCPVCHSDLSQSQSCGPDLTICGECGNTVSSRYVFLSQKQTDRIHLADELRSMDPDAFPDDDLLKRIELSFADWLHVPVENIRIRFGCLPVKTWLKFCNTKYPASIYAYAQKHTDLPPLCMMNSDQKAEFSRQVMQKRWKNHHADMSAEEFKARTAGYTQKEISAMIGISVPKIASWTNKLRVPICGKDAEIIRIMFPVIRNDELQCKETESQNEIS